MPEKWTPTVWVPRTIAAQQALIAKQQEIDKLNQPDVTSNVMNVAPEATNIAQSVTPAEQPIPDMSSWYPARQPQPVNNLYTTGNKMYTNVPTMGTNIPNAGMTQTPVSPIGETAPNIDTTAPKTETPTQWWQQPAVVTEKAMNVVGQVAAKVPLLPQVLKFAEPVFKGLDILDKYWAGTVLSAFSPVLPWRKEENWFDHEKREYEAWQAPTYVKGTAEFAMPLYWLPYVGWMAKGTVALRAGSKISQALGGVLGVAARAANLGMPVKALTKPSPLAQAVQQSVKSGALELPTDAFLNTMYKPDMFRRFAQATENIPVLKNIVQVIGGPAAVVRENPTTPEQIAQQALVNSSIIKSMAGGVSGYLFPALQAKGDFNKIVGLVDNVTGEIKGIVSKDPAASHNFYDVLEGVMKDPTTYTYATPEIQSTADTLHSIVGQFVGLETKEGVRRNANDLLLHRRVIGWADANGKLIKSIDGSEQSLGRVYKTAAEGAKAGVVYDYNIYRSVTDSINAGMGAIARKRLTEAVKPLGNTAKDMWANLNPIDAGKFSDLTEQLGMLDTKIQPAIQRALRGESLPGATRTIIQNPKYLPDTVSAKLDAAYTISRDKVDDVITGVVKSIKRDATITVGEFKTKLGEYKKAQPGFTGAFNKNTPILVGDVTGVLEGLVKDKARLVSVVEKTFKGYYQTMGDAKKNILKSMIDDIKNVRILAKTELQPINTSRSTYLSHYQGKINSRLQLAKFSGIPEFGDRLFPADVVATVEKSWRDNGQAWLKNLSTASGISRMMTATLDLSAGFIQGLVLAGTDPIGWSKGMVKMVEWTFKPQNYVKWAASPKTQALWGEMLKAGSLLAPFEYTEAFGPLKELIGKVPKVGGVLQKAVQQTYGRAEVAFTGFGQYARTSMWDAMTRQYRAGAVLNLADDAQRDIAHSIDLMTGQMSTTALGIGTTQQQFESAFMFFAPRYTRAGMALMGNVMKGGLTGQIARDAVGSMMVGGMTYYIGICKALGQTPNLDPSTGRFMTVQVGQQHLGVGGIYTGMLRFMYDLGTTTVSHPGSLLAPDRFDNPFLKFLYARASPLTGMAYGLAIEHKDYLGAPFETPADWATFLVDKIVPIGFQSLPQIISDEGAKAPEVFTAQLLGMRMFPTSSLERMKETQNKAASAIKPGATYADLTLMQQYQINKLPKVLKYQAEANKQTARSGTTLSVAFLNRHQEMDDAWQTYKDSLQKLQDNYDLGLITGYDFKNAMQDARTGLSATYAHINSNPEYKDVMLQLQNPKATVQPQFLGDACYLEWIQALNSNQFDDPVSGIFDNAKYGQYKDVLKVKYGDAAYQGAVDYMNRKNEELPPLAQEYLKSRDILKTYWEVPDWAAKNYGQAWAESSRGVSFINKMKKQLRQQDPVIAKYYDMFYKQTA